MPHATPQADRKGTHGWLRHRLIRFWTVAAVLVASGHAHPAQAQEYERDPIRYSHTAASNPVAELQRRLGAGEATLAHEEHFGYLRSLLKELRIPESSQTLVFSKTSLQRQRIAPRTPRSLYFNDNVYVGFCQDGDVLELSAADPKLGTVFYTLDQSPADKPYFVRQTDACLLCHGSSQTHGVPGHLVRSLYSDASGNPIFSAGSHRIDHNSPLAQRWGSWYVTGKHGEQTHLGNLIIKTRSVVEPVDNRAGMNVLDLGDRLVAKNFLSTKSDIVALMVLEHQTEGHNLLTRAGFLTRMALHQEAALNRETGQPADHRWDSTRTRIKDAAEPLVRYLLMSEEALLTAKLEGTSGFAEEFARQGPRDDNGRSLRDLDLERRLFKYPCSYLIYSPSFNALPAEARDYILKRMWEVLTEKDTTSPFAHLSTDDRRAILEILRATMKDLPPYWRGC